MDRKREEQQQFGNQAAKRTAGVYLHPDVLLIHAQHRTTAGFDIAAAPVFRLSSSAANADIGKTLRETFAAFRANVPVPADWKSFGKDFHKLSGFRSWKALQGKAKSCWIAAEEGQFVFTLLRNGGTKGEQKGFQPFGAPPTRLPINASDDELGSALMKVLAQCE